MDLDLAKFEPTTAALTEMAASFKGLVINGVEDKVGLKAVHEARITLKNARVAITKRGKEMREDALAFQKKVIAKESELIALIQPVEQDLAAKEDAVEIEKEKIKRAEKLPARRASVSTYEGTASDDELLVMDDHAFDVHLNDLKSSFLERKEAALNAETARLAEEKQKIEDEKNAGARESARLDAIKKAEAREEAHRLEVEAARQEATLKATQEAERIAKLAEDVQKAKEEDDAIRAVAEQKKIAKRVGYTKWLKACGYTEANKADFTIIRNENVITLYRMVSTFTIE